MVWNIYAVNRSKTTSNVLALLHNGQSNLVAVVSPSHSAPGNHGSSIISAFYNPQTGEWDQQREQGRSMIVEAVNLAQEKGLFGLADLRTDSVLYIRTGDGARHAELVHETDSHHVFCSLLKPPSEIVPSGGENFAMALGNALVSYEDVIYEKPLPSWRMTCTKASLVSSPGGEFVYKGISFYQFLVCGPENFRHEVDACYREIRMVNHVLPPHPNIIPPAKYLVYTNFSRRGGSERLICGSLYAYLTKGALANVLDESARDKIRLPLSKKAKWCYQLCSAMSHVHLKAKSYHQDLKPPNVLVDDGENLLIVDWEQSGANPFILAPEADGSFDVCELDEEVNGRRRLVFYRYEGPARIKHPIGGMVNIFPEWHQNHPKAVELAEVYALGKTMWVLLEQVGLEHEPGVTDYSSQTLRWSSWSEDIPERWKRTVEASFANDPNDRPLISELLQFWEKEWQQLA